MIPLRKLGGSRYQTLDGRYQIERQDGWTECDHPLCDTLHRKWHTSTNIRGGSGGGWQHLVSYVAWHIWDNELDDYLDHNNEEYDTKREAHQDLTDYLARCGDRQST